MTRINPDKHPNLAPLQAPGFSHGVHDWIGSFGRRYDTVQAAYEAAATAYVAARRTGLLESI